MVLEKLGKHATYNVDWEPELECRREPGADWLESTQIRSRQNGWPRGRGRGRRR
jgi:hypothetical protein